MRNLADRESDGLTTGRLEGFSDGVLAIAITLLVLQLGEGEGSLAHRLGEEWPFFLSYFDSLVNIGVVDPQPSSAGPRRHRAPQLLWIEEGIT